MDSEEFKILENCYKHIVNQVFTYNLKFFKNVPHIKWGFDNSPNNGIMAVCRSKDNIIVINLEKFMEMYFEKNYIEIEYLLMHETRHIFQHCEINRLNNGEETILDKEIVEKWAYESKHYIKALDENNIENPKYFEQDMEMDAFAFAYAVMKYKYGYSKEKFYSAMQYKENFDSIVDNWVKYFEELKIEKKNLVFIKQSLLNKIP